MATTATKRQNRYETYGNVAYKRAHAPARERVHAPEAAPQIRTRERIYVRPRAVVREAGHVSVFAVVGFALVGALAVLLLLSYAQLMTSANDTVGMRKELEVLQGENAKLRTQYELAYDLKSIEDAVLSTGTMVKPQSGQIVVLDLSEPDNLVVFGTDSGPSLTEQFFVWAKSLISGRLE